MGRLIYEGIYLFVAFNVFNNIRALENHISILTTNGELVGKESKFTIEENNSFRNVSVQTFLGIPFAQPPVGELRFQAPREPKSWNGKRIATEHSKSCVQVTSRPGTDKTISEDDVSEDCLYLNVWVPIPVPKEAAVMVFIYGGAFLGGSSKFYNWETLAATEGVIVVSMNYRISSLGFLYLGNEDCPGNMGLWDQQLALKWVQNNINSFGGNPNRVTIFGHSAGSTSTGLHLLNPNYQGLFKRVIMQSGAPIGSWASDTKAEAYAKSVSVLKSVGCGGNISNIENTMKCLRKTKAVDLVSASAKFGDVLALFHIPVMDNKMVFENIQDSLNGLKAKDVLMGVTNNDGAFIVRGLLASGKVPPSNLMNVFADMYFGIRNTSFLGLMKYYFKDHCGNDNHLFLDEISTTRLATNHLFSCYTFQLADDLAKAGIKAFVYQWTHRPYSTGQPLWVEADHGAEMKFLTHSDVQIQEKELSRRMMDYWGNFAKYGNPNGKGGDAALRSIRRPNKTNNRENNVTVKIQRWVEYSSDSKNRLDIDLYHSLSTSGRLNDDQCFFLKNILPNFSQIN